jgi:hypothetical protein
VNVYGTKPRNFTPSKAAQTGFTGENRGREEATLKDRNQSKPGRETPNSLFTPRKTELAKRNTAFFSASITRLASVQRHVFLLRSLGPRKEKG